MKRLIFAVEDDESIRELYACALEGAGMDIECFESGAEMLNRLAEKAPDLFVLDVMLDGMSGLEILEVLRNDRGITAPVIMVSARGDEMSKVKGLNLGADDYIAKPFGVLELIARVNANLRKSGGKKLLSYGDVIIDEGAHRLVICGNENSCTLKEYNLLKLLVERAGTVVSRDEIFNRVWGAEFYGESRTIDMHITALRRLLENNGSRVHIETVRGVGFILK